MTHPKKTLIAFATRWGAQFGGINSFNQDLLSAFAAACYQQVSTVCVVLSASEAEQKSALCEQVRLVPLDRPEQDTFSRDLEAATWQALQENGIQLHIDDTVWLGHDRITGAVALAAKLERGGRSALIHHMSYSRYEAFSENSDIAKRKEIEQKELFEKADIVMAVGPLLRDALADMLDEPNVSILVPGLPDIIVKGAPKNFKGFLSGRLSDGAKRIKQAHLGVAAFADAIRQSDENTGLPDALRGENEPMLTLRGVDFENIHASQDVEAESALKLFAEEYAGRAINMHALPFTTDRKVLFDDLRSASVAMMPSWHEGFGLVAWEAIAAGVPLIISNKSGAFRMLKEFEDGVYTSCVTSIDVAGSSSEPYFLAKDVSNLAQTIISVAKDPIAARQKAARLREALSSKFTWASCARQVADALEWRIEVGPVAIASSARSTIPQPATSTSTIDLLELPSPSWQPDTGLSDSQLLRAEEAIVPFDPKCEPFLKEQIDWAESTANPISVRLLTGAGGVGKTRLALELCQRMQARDWQAGFLLGDCDTSIASRLTSQITAADQPCCIVIDYAETRQPLLLAVLKSLLISKTKQYVRVLLLARDGGEWWGALPAKDPNCEYLLEGSATSGPFLLPQLHDTELERQEAYRLALHTFSSLLQIEPPEHQPDLSEAHFARPLYIQMAALMALRGERPKSAEGLPRAVINHERRYWGRVLYGLEQGRDDIEQQAALLMTLATLANGITTERSIEELWRLIGEDKSLLKRLFKALSPLYPDRQGLQGLRPDLIGEALVAQSLLGSSGPALLDAVLRKGDSRLRQSSLTVLARLLRNRADISAMLEDALAKNFLTCADDLVQVCIETPSPLPQIVENAYRRLPIMSQSQVAGVLDPRFEFEILPLTGLNILIRQSIVNKKAEQKRKKPTPGGAALYADALHNLAIALNSQGRIEEALAAAKQSLDIYQELEQAKPQRFMHDLAAALVNYAKCLAEQGRTDEALVAARQGLDIYQELALTKPEQFMPELAMSLNNYANHASEQDQHEEALAAAKQALNIYQELVLTKPERFTPDLAMSLSNYANHAMVQGQSEKALAACKQALSIYQELALAKPERFTPNLAMSLSNYSSHLSNQGMVQEAATPAQQALDIRQELAQSKPQRFTPDVAGSLNNYAFILAMLGQSKEALAAVKQSLSIFQELALAKPERFNSDVALVLKSFSNHLIKQGQQEEALAASKQALGIYQELAQTNPDRFSSVVAGALDHYAFRLAEHGRSEEALSATKQALGLYQKLAIGKPVSYQGLLESSRLKLMLWQWLISDGNKLGKVNIPLLEIADPHEQREIEFYQCWLLAWDERALDSIQRALNCWANLNFRQQYNHEEEFLLLAALAEYRFGPSSAPSNWREKLEYYHKQRQGRIPHWMAEMARRGGFEL